jgi:hypothetical protein
LESQRKRNEEYERRFIPSFWSSFIQAHTHTVSSKIPLIDHFLNNQR